MHYLTVVSIMCKTNVYSQVRKHVIKVLPVRFLLEIYRIWRLYMLFRQFQHILQG